MVFGQVRFSCPNTWKAARLYTLIQSFKTEINGMYDMVTDYFVVAYCPAHTARANLHQSKPFLPVP